MTANLHIVVGLDDAAAHEPTRILSYKHMLQAYQADLFSPGPLSLSQCHNARQLSASSRQPTLPQTSGFSDHSPQGFPTFSEALSTGSFMSPMTVQQQLADLQQLIMALGAATSSYPQQFSIPFLNPGMTSEGAPFYLKNSITSFPSLSTQNYGSGSFENSSTLFPNEKLNGHNYFSRSQSVYLALEGHHRFRYLTREIARPRPGDPQERMWN